MFWQSITADRWLELEAIRQALAEAFTLSIERVQVVDDIAALTEPVPPEPRILAERTRRDGDFPLQLDVFLAADEIERVAVPFTGALSYMRALAHRLDVTMLIAEGPIESSEEIRVSPDGAIDIVRLDGDALDDERWVIIGSRPFSELPAEALQAPV